MKRPTIVCFGECLIDCLPGQQLVGGALLNVAIRLRSFDVNTHFISSVGQDENGDKILDFMRERHLPSHFVSTHSTLPTSKVLVTLDNAGVAEYEIVEPVAWDEISFQDRFIEAVKVSDALIFGSLSLRNKFNRNTIEKLLPYVSYKIVDLNLRTPFYSEEIIRFCLDNADLVKVNNEELVEVLEMLGGKSQVQNSHQNFDELLHAFAQKTKVKQICLTEGGDGARFFNHGTIIKVDGKSAKVVDTVGAGDSFLAAFVNQLFCQTMNSQNISNNSSKTGLNITSKDIEYALTYGCAVGSLVTEHHGPNPIISREQIVNRINHN